MQKKVSENSLLNNKKNNVLSVCGGLEQKEIASSVLATEALRAKSRKARKHVREKRRKAANFVKDHKKDVGTQAYRATYEGFTKKTKLPHHFSELFNEARRFVYSQKEYTDQKGVVRSITSRGHRKLLEVLIVLLSSCDLMSGQVGLAKSLHMDTTSHDAFMLQHAKRFGYAISSSSWYRYIDILKSMEIFRGEEIRIFNEEDKTVRSDASYKYLSEGFLARIGAFKDHIRVSIKLAYQKALDKGLSFAWKIKNEPVSTSTRNFDLFTSPPPNIKPS